MEMPHQFVTLIFGERFRPRHSACGDIAVFGKACSLVTVCVVPFIEALRRDVAVVSTADKTALAVVAPGSCEKYRTVCHAVFACEAASVKYETYLLRKGVSGCGCEASAANICDRAYLAVFKQRIAAAEYEIHIARDDAVCKALGKAARSAQRVFKKALVAGYKVIGERTSEDCILR